MFKKIIKAQTNDVLINQGQGYFPQDIRKTYNLPNHYGKGQTIGILEFSNGYNLKDAIAFWSSHGIKTPNVSFVGIQGATNDNGMHSTDMECTLDLQWIGALVPESHIVVYEANAGATYATFAQAVTEALTYVLNDTTYKPSVLSVSYGDAEATFGPSICQEWADLIQKLDVKGITVVVASGDQGAYGMHNLAGPRIKHADAPATSPYAVAVGGTSLSPSGQETAWTYNGPQNGGATGGGYSKLFKPRSGQSAKGGFRGLPDVAFNADPATGYQINFGGSPMVVGGTSVAAPVFASIVTLLNEALQNQNLPVISGLSSLLYDKRVKGFRDITQGNNDYNNVVGYDAVTGWDPCTGLGSLDASTFIDSVISLKKGDRPMQTNYVTAFDSALAVTSMVQSNLNVFQDACDWYASTPKFWIRYLTGGGAGVTPIDIAEVNFLHSKNVGIYLMYNGITPATLQKGYQGGTGDAQVAISLAKSLGAPSGVLLGGDVEAGWPLNVEWIKGWADTMKASIYGGAGSLYGSISQPYFATPYNQAVAESANAAEVLLFGAAWNQKPWSKVTKPKWQPPVTSQQNANRVFAWQAAGASYGGIVDLDLIADPLPQVDSNPLTLWMPPTQSVKKNTPSSPSTIAVSVSALQAVKSAVAKLP